MNWSCNFDVFLDLEFSEPYGNTLVYEERQKPDTLAVIDNNNICDTHTHGHADSMTDPVQRAELVKTGV